MGFIIESLSYISQVNETLSCDLRLRRAFKLLYVSVPIYILYV